MGASANLPNWDWRILHSTLSRTSLCQHELFLRQQRFSIFIKAADVKFMSINESSTCSHDCSVSQRHDVTVMQWWVGFYQSFTHINFMSPSFLSRKLYHKEIISRLKLLSSQTKALVHSKCLVTVQVAPTMRSKVVRSSMARVTAM